jgi:hypothetical protein
MRSIEEPHSIIGLKIGGMRYSFSALRLLFSAAAARISVLRAPPSTSSPSWRSIARLVLPSRLELNRPEGSSSEAPLAKRRRVDALDSYL